MDESAATKRQHFHFTVNFESIFSFSLIFFRFYREELSYTPLVSIPSI